MIKQIIFSIFLLFAAHWATAQVPPITPAQAQAQLDKKGISEQEIRQRMQEKGYDLDNLDSSNPAEVVKFQKALEDTIAELEAEKKGQATGGNGSSSSSNSTSTPDKAENLESKQQQNEKNKSVRFRYSIRRAQTVRYQHKLMTGM